MTKYYLDNAVDGQISLDKLLDIQQNFQYQFDPLHRLQEYVDYVLVFAFCERLFGIGDNLF